MGIVEKELAAFEFSNGQQHRVELNTGGAIHLHMGNVRLDMTEEEFRHFVSVIAEARDRLREEKSLDGSEGASAEADADGVEATDPAAKAQDDD
jgi:hypothetical protein